MTSRRSDLDLKDRSLSASIPWCLQEGPDNHEWRGARRAGRLMSGIWHGAARSTENMTEEHRKMVGRTFRHFKGNLYRLEGFAKNSETLEEMVVYRALYGELGLWVRPARMFFETVERDGRTMKRFELAEGLATEVGDDA